MIDLWYQCEECPFGTNSKKQANKHWHHTGHEIAKEGTEIDEE